MSKPNGKSTQNKVENLPVRTIVKVVTEDKSPTARQEIKGKLAENKTGSQTVKQTANSTKTTTPELKSSQSSSNLSKESKIKNILKTSKPDDNILKDIMKVTDVDSNVNIIEVDHDDKLKTIPERVREKSVQSRKQTANTKPTASPTPTATSLKGAKSSITSKANDTGSKNQGILKKVDSTNDLSSNSTTLTASKTLNKMPSSKSVNIKIL